MKNILITLALSMAFSHFATAQRHETLFNGRNGLTGFWFSSSFNYNRMSDDLVLMPGSYAAFEFGRTLLVGWGGYRLTDAVNSQSSDTPIDMRYRGVYLGITPWSNKVVHPKIGVLGGRGRVNGQRDLLVIQPAAGLEVNIFRWFRLGLEGGYRFVGGSRIDGVTNADLSAPFAQLDLRFGFSW